MYSLNIIGKSTERFVEIEKFSRKCWLIKMKKIPALFAEEMPALFGIETPALFDVEFSTFSHGRY